MQAGHPFWGKLPEELLVSVFNALDHPRDLLACACVCKPWRSGKAKAVMSVLDLHHDDLKWLSQLTHAQMAAVRDVQLRFISAGPGYATASAMLLAFICGRLSMPQRLKLDWGNNYQQEDLSEEEGRDGLIWQRSDLEMFCAILPSSLHALKVAGVGRVSLPDLTHLTALTELRLDWVWLTPKGGQLPRLPALQVLSLIGASYTKEDQDDPQGECPGPKDLGLAHATPLLAEVCFALDYEMSAPHEQLATLAPLAHLKTIILDFFYEFVEDCALEEGEEGLLRPDTLLSLPPSVTKLVLCGFAAFLPALKLPENIATVYEKLANAPPFD